MDEGPVDLTDPGRAALDIAVAGPGQADAEIIWDDGPSDTTPRERRDQDRRQPPNVGAVPGHESEPFWEDDLKRAAASPTRDKPGPRRKPPEPASTADDTYQTLKHQRPGTARGPRPATRRQTPAVEELEVATGWRRPRPLTLVLILVPLLLVTAAVWRYRRSLRQEYPLIAETGRLEGIPALDEGNFDKAYQLLSAAKSAVDSLGGEVKDAEEIRKAADQAAIFVDRCPRLLEDMLDEAGRTDPAVWESKFDTLYKGRAIVIDSIIKEAPEPGPSSRYMLEYVVFPPGGATNFTEGRDARPDRFALIDLKGFELFDLARPQKGDHVSFGARLASFQPDPSHDFWWIGLEPKSGVFITRTKALEAIGLPGAGNVEGPAETQP